MLYFYTAATTNCSSVSLCCAITFTTATVVRAASLQLLPRALLPFIPPKPIPVPNAGLRPCNCVPHFASSTATHFIDTDSTRVRTANTSLRALALHNSPAHPVLASCASASTGRGGGHWRCARKWSQANCSYSTGILRWGTTS
jgi:hypothetical protein